VHGSNIASEVGTDLRVQLSRRLCDPSREARLSERMLVTFWPSSLFLPLWAVVLPQPPT
jgi:hypothetical protein